MHRWSTLEGLWRAEFEKLGRIQTPPGRAWPGLRGSIWYLPNGNKAVLTRLYISKHLWRYTICAKHPFFSSTKAPKIPSLFHACSFGSSSSDSSLGGSTSFLSWKTARTQVILNLKVFRVVCICCMVIGFSLVHRKGSWSFSMTSSGMCSKVATSTLYLCNVAVTTSSWSSNSHHVKANNTLEALLGEVFLGKGQVHQKALHKFPGTSCRRLRQTFSCLLPLHDANFLLVEASVIGSECRRFTKFLEIRNLMSQHLGKAKACKSWAKFLCFSNITNHRDGCRM